MAEDWVRLNVGGTIFLTTQSTLRNEDSFLSHLLGGADENSFRAAPTDADGCVRVDRSPAVFDLVLDYLRNLENFVAPIFPSRDFTLLEREAKFFGLEGLSQALALVRAETDAARNSLSSSARVMRSFVNNGGDRLVHLSGLPDVVSDQHIFLAMERLSLRSLSSEPVIPFPQPSFLRTLRDPLRPVAPGSGFMCKGSAILAYNCVAHAARAIAAVNSGAMPIIDGNPLSGVTLFAAWADEPSVPPFAFEEASIMSIEIGPTPQVMHARPIPPIDHPFHQQQVPAAAGAAGNEDPMQAILAASLAAARGQAQVLAQVQAQAQVVQAQAQVVQAHAAQAAQAVQAQAQAQAEAQAQVMAAGAPRAPISFVAGNPVIYSAGNQAQVLAHFTAVLSNTRAQISALNGLLANTEREIAHAPDAGASQAVIDELTTRRTGIIAQLQFISRQEQDLERTVANIRAGRAVGPHVPPQQGAGGNGEAAHA